MLGTFLPFSTSLFLPAAARNVTHKNTNKKKTDMCESDSTKVNIGNFNYLIITLDNTASYMVE